MKTFSSGGIREMAGMRRHSVIVWQSVLAAIALVACACSSPQPTAGSGTNAAPATAQPTAAPAAASQAKVEMRFAWWGSQDRHNRTIKAIELFQQMHPNITFTYEFAGFDDYFTKMATY